MNSIFATIGLFILKNIESGNDISNIVAFFDETIQKNLKSLLYTHGRDVSIIVLSYMKIHNSNPGDFAGLIKKNVDVLASQLDLLDPFSYQLCELFSS